MSYASRVEHDRFPETYVLVEGERGSVELGPDYWIRVTTAQGTHVAPVSAAALRLGRPAL